jgi:type IV secretion system protein VirB5
MKNMKKLALVLGLAFTCNHAAFAGIPTIDSAAIANSVTEFVSTNQEYQAQVKRWESTDQHHKNELEAYEKQLESQTGERKIGVLINEYNVNKFEFPSVNSLMSSGRGALSDQAKKMFDEYNLFDNCQQKDKSLRDNCDAQAVVDFQRMAMLDEANENLNKKLEEIGKVAERIKTSKDTKESQDLTNVMQLKMSELDMERSRLEIALAQQQTQRDILLQQKEQLGAKRRSAEVPKFESFTMKK